MDIIDKLREYKDEVIDQPYEYASTVAHKIIAYVDGLEARIAELESENVILTNITNGFKRLNPPSCTNCKHEQVKYNEVPCLGCHGFDKWEAYPCQDYLGGGDER